jgi:hypothetical protein
MRQVNVAYAKQLLINEQNDLRGPRDFYDPFLSISVFRQFE